MLTAVGCTFLWVAWYFRLPDGSLMEITKIYPLDAVFDNLDDVPEDVMYIKQDSLYLFRDFQTPNKLILTWSFYTDKSQ